MRVRRLPTEAWPATKNKADFPANMSHEIRPAMNAIIGFAGPALMTGLDVKQRDYIRKIQMPGVHLLGVIDGDDLLT